MQYNKKTWTNRETEYPNQYRMVSTNGNIANVSIIPDSGEVTVPGEEFDAATMNDMETRINNGFNAVNSDISAQDTTLRGLIAAETTRATGEEQLIENAIDQLNTDLTAEVTRARGVEDALISDVTTLTTRVDEGEDDIDSLEDRMTNAESDITTVNSRITGLETSISVETNRATQAETTLQGNIDTVSSAIAGEVTRATNAENALGTRVTTLEATATRAYKAAGSVLFADLPALAESRQGFVYNIRDDFTTTSDFIEGAGKDYPAGTDVAIVAVEGTPITYKYNVMSGFIDTSDFVKDTDYATTSGAGIVKPDGTTTSVDANGVISVIGGAGGGGSTWVGTCTSAADAQTKVVTVDNAFELEVGARICVKFTNSNSYSATAENKVSLNVNNTGARNIYYNNSNAPTGTNTNVFGYANRYIFYVYDGTNWVWDGSGVDNNTTYSAMSVSELTTGTATSQRTVRADYLHTAIQTMIDDSVGAAIAASY